MNTTDSTPDEHETDAAGAAAPRYRIEERLDAWVRDAGRVILPSLSAFDPVIRPSKHADFQINGALAAAKSTGMNPRELAKELLDAVTNLDTDHPKMIATMDVAGPGFINVTISPEYLAIAAEELRSHAHLGIAQTTTPKTVVVDYASPNIAKSMHVGHLRTCIIGDAFVRSFAAAGHTAIRQDHQGDWGTQFGMLIEYLVDTGDPQGAANSALHDLDGLYQSARSRFDAEPEFAERARARVVALQDGDAETLRLWQVLVTTSQRYFEEEYRALGILMQPEDVRGESFYNDMLDDTVDALIEKGLAKPDDGALCVYPEGFTGRDGKPFAFIVRKSDGGYNYAATDLAAVRYSVNELGATHLLYVTDVRQSQHFHMVFAVARAAGWLPQSVKATHVGYGAVLGKDGKPYKTREGTAVRLGLLLDEAVRRAETLISERVKDVDDVERARIARAVGIGAVKWSDLKNECKNNYTFDFDRMLAFQGNTGPYVQYASTRAKSVLRKANAHEAALTSPFSLTEEPERMLVLSLLGFGQSVALVNDRCEPHHLCAYLFELAERFTTLYEQCPILSAEENVKQSRLALCSLTAHVLDTGLSLLGIDAVDRM